MRAAVEPNQAPTLLVYTDSDLASCPYTSKSTSGVVYVLQTGSSYFPLPWSSSQRKQSSTARSTTEAELIACASALFGEALNLHTMIEPLTEVSVPVSFQQDIIRLPSQLSSPDTVLQSSIALDESIESMLHPPTNNWIKVFLTWITVNQPLSWQTDSQKSLDRPNGNRRSNSYVLLLMNESKESIEVGQEILCFGPRKRLAMCMYRTRGELLICV